MARLRATPEDFLVEEIALYEPSGEGAHTFVWVEKRGRSTEEIARALARVSGAEARDVGYAGRKDRWAVARQWFSVPGLEPERALSIELPEARVLRAARHPHKLRTGQLRANRFELRVREVGAEAAAAAQRELDRAVRVGMPNRYGEQRFGRDGDNAERGRALLEGRLRPRDRRAARFWLSALQAELFNAALERRSLPLDQVELGDLAQVCASGGVFLVEDLAREAPRAAAFEISATGPIFGTRMSEPAGVPAERERAVLEAFGIAPPAAWKVPRGLRVRGARRPLRVRPEGATASHADGVLQLAFTLPAGSYATVLVQTLLGPDVENGPAAEPFGGNLSAPDSSRPA